MAESPHLAMDERMLLDARTGVATYAQALHRALTTIDGQAILIGDRRIPSRPPPAPLGRAGRWARGLFPLARRAKAEIANSSRCITTDLFRLAQVYFDIWGRPMRLRLPGPPGIVHWTYPLPVKVVGWRNVYTVHDAIPLVSSSFTPIDPLRHRRLLEMLAREAAAFVTVSEAARAEIIDALGLKSLPIVNCGQAISSKRGMSGPLPCGLSPRGYLLVVGAVEKRKNIPAIIEGHRRSGTKMPLVIVGPDGWDAEAIAPHFAARSVVRVSYLPVDQLRKLIAEAHALLMVSLAEGFGLPIAEAMALGTPVITADRGAQAETAGGAALLVNPAAPEAIAAAITSLMEDQSLWNSLAERGRNRAAAFTMDNFVASLRAFYANL